MKHAKDKITKPKGKSNKREVLFTPIKSKNFLLILSISWQETDVSLTNEQEFEPFTQLMYSNCTSREAKAGSNS